MTNTVEAHARGAQYVREQIHLTMWRRRVSQQKMADHLGLNQSTFSKKMRGRVPMTLEELLSIAAFLEVQPRDLLPWDQRAAA